MNEIYTKGQQAAIQAIYDAAVGKDEKIHITFMVSDPDGNYFNNVMFPIGTDHPAHPDSAMKLCTINISMSACQHFYLDEDTGDFVYDVLTQGKQFMGNIPTGSVVNIVGINNNQAEPYFHGASLWHKSSEEDAPVTQSAPKPPVTQLSGPTPVPNKPPRKGPPHLQLVKK